MTQKDYHSESNFQKNASSKRLKNDSALKVTFRKRIPKSDSENIAPSLNPVPIGRFFLCSEKNQVS
jgi:hypothetical protein